MIELKLRQYDCTPEFRYTRKKIEYSYSEKKILDSVIFYITKSDQPGVLSVMEEINHSTHLCFWNMKVPYHDFGKSVNIPMRYFTECFNKKRNSS